MRWAVLVCLIAMLVGCSDLRDFRGEWTGTRVGEGEPLADGLDQTAAPLALSIDDVDRYGLRGRLAIAGVLPETAIASLPGAEADALASLTFNGSPLRVYLAFAAMPDGAGDALVIIALFDDRRVEVRLLRGGGTPIYAIFPLREPAR